MYGIIKMYVFMRQKDCKIIFFRCNRQLEKTVMLNSEK